MFDIFIFLIQLCFYLSFTENGMDAFTIRLNGEGKHTGFLVCIYNLILRIITRVMQRVDARCNINKITDSSWPKMFEKGLYSPV